MKISTPFLGVLVALVVACLVHVTRTASSEVISIMYGTIMIIPVGLLGVKYRQQQVRDEQLRMKGLNHYREHVHHRKVIRKTS
jgi:high-affinity K+ transport system ATPase subunit B